MKLKDFNKKLQKNPEIKKEFEKVDLAFEIGEMIIEARVLKGITQHKLAQLVNTKQPSIARLENGEHLPSLSFLERIAHALNSHLIPPKFAFMVDINNVISNSSSTKNLDETITVSDKIHHKFNDSVNEDNYNLTTCYKYA